VLFLVFVGLCLLVIVFAGERLVDEARGIGADFQQMLENFAGQALGGQTVHRGGGC